VFGLSSLDELPETELSPTAVDEKSLAVEEVGFIGGNIDITDSETESIETTTEE
jgi:hypothetical protein